jgi:hypothetical protein
VHHQAVEKRTIVQTISDLAAHLRSGKVTCASGALADASTSGAAGATGERYHEIPLDHEPSLH